MTAIFSPTDPSSPSFYSSTQTALLLLDFQNFTIAQCPSGTSAVSQAQKLLDWARSNDVLIIHSIVDLSPSAIPTTIKNHSRLKSYIETLSSDPNNSSIPPALCPSDSSFNELVCLKTPGIVSALSMPDVAEILGERGIKSLVICGLSTSGAVLRTATQATDSELVVSVIEDACGDKTEEVHETVMGKILGNRCHVCKAGKWIGEWEGRGEDPTG